MRVSKLSIGLVAVFVVLAGLMSIQSAMAGVAAGVVYNNALGGGGRSDVGSYGNTFTVSQTLYVSALGTQDTANLNGSASTGAAFGTNTYQTGIWNSSQTLLAYATISSSDPESGTYVYDSNLTITGAATTASNGQLELLSGQTYTIGTAAFSNSSTPGTPINIPWIIGNDNSPGPGPFSYNGAADVTLTNTVFKNTFTTVGGILLDPTSGNGNGTGGWGPASLLVDTVPAPEPASLSLLGLAGLGLLARRRTQA